MLKVEATSPSRPLQNPGLPLLPEVLQIQMTKGSMTVTVDGMPMVKRHTALTCLVIQPANRRRFQRQKDHTPAFNPTRATQGVPILQLSLTHKAIRCDASISPGEKESPFPINILMIRRKSHSATRFR